MILADLDGYPKIFFSRESAEEKRREIKLEYGVDLTVAGVETPPRKLEPRKYFGEYSLASEKPPIQTTLTQDFLDNYLIPALVGVSIISLASIYASFRT